MGRRRSGCILMALGVLVALVAGGITYFLVNQSTAQKTADVPTRKVLVAAVNIPERTLINLSQLRVQDWPVDVIPPGALTSVDDGNNKFAMMPIYAGQVVLQTQVADTKGGSGVAYALEKGKVLVVMNIPAANGIVAAGALRVGDTVDLVVNTEGSNGDQVAPTIQNLKIYAIGNVNTGAKQGAAPAAGPQAAPTLFVFQVSPQDALVLKFLETMKTDIVLRPAGDDTIVPTEPVTIDYLVSRYRLQRPPPKQ